MYELEALIDASIILAEAQKTDEALALMYIALDRAKAINAGTIEE